MVGNMMLHVNFWLSFSEETRLLWGEEMNMCAGEAVSDGPFFILYIIRCKRAESLRIYFL